MKTVLYDEKNKSIVVALVYFDEAKRFIAGYANGDMCLYDENVLEECHLIRKFESHSRHSELLDLRFNYRNRTAATAGGSSGIAKLWDYDSGKCENELLVCDSHDGYIVHIMLLMPYPIVVTSDSFGNIVLWGTRGLKWQGLRLSGFANGTPVTADHEPRVWKSDEVDEKPRRAMPPSGESSTASVLSSIAEKGNGKLSRQNTGMLATDGEKSEKSSVKMVRLRKSQTFSFDDSGIETEQEAEQRANSQKAAEKLIKDSAAKWGKVAAAHAICWDEQSYLLFAGDDLGCLRCYNLRDIFLDLNLDLTDIEYYVHSNLGNRPIGLCKKKQRDERSALPPIAQSANDIYVLGKKSDYMAYLGVEFCWALDAHTDRIISCANAPNGILTSSADRLVKMWSFDGLPIGTLLQSVPVGTKSRTWDLHLDVETMIQKENEELDEIIQQVTDLVEKTEIPDINELDFTGMKLGAESADFSKSELRQRIEKTGKLLGLDFPGQQKARAQREKEREQLHHDEMGSLADGSSVSTANKSLADALKEIKSTESGVDYESKTKQMTWVQQRRKANKLDAISKTFEAKTGVKINITAPVPGGTHADEESEKSAEHSTAVDQMLMSLQTDVKSHRDDASANEDLYSVGSNDVQLKLFVPHKRRETSNSKSKIAESIQQAHDRGPRTISMEKSCKKFDAYKELDNSMTLGNRRINQTVTEDQILAMRARRETKHKLFFLNTMAEATSSNPSTTLGGGAGIASGGSLMRHSSSGSQLRKEDSMMSGGDSLTQFTQSVMSNDS